VVTLRIMRGSSDDRFLSGLMIQSDRDFVSAPLANGSYVKRLGDGEQNVTRDVYTLLAGVFQKNNEHAGKR